MILAHCEILLLMFPGRLEFDTTLRYATLQTHHPPALLRYDFWRPPPSHHLSIYCNPTCSERRWTGGSKSYQFLSSKPLREFSHVLRLCILFLAPIFSDVPC